MREIDNTTNREQWLQAVQHLAVRRLIWENKTAEVGKDGLFPGFLPEDKPTYSCYLSEAKNDVIELIAILQTTLMNKVDPTLVRDKLNSASIDLSQVIAIAKRLNDVNERKYPFNEKALYPLIDAGVKGDIHK